MPAWVKAGTVYFVTVFAVGFVLGTMRVLLVIPRVGETVAVCLELPLMLAAAWVACRWLRSRIPCAQPIAMGVWAFGVLMVAELGLAVLLFGQTPAEHFARYRAFPTQLGLAGQMVFGLIPFLQSKTEKTLPTAV